MKRTPSRSGSVLLAAQDNGNDVRQGFNWQVERYAGEGSIIVALSVGFFLADPHLDDALGVPIFLGAPLFVLFGVTLIILGLLPKERTKDFIW